VQNVLFETLSVHPIVLYLTDPSAAAAYQNGLSEFMQPKLLACLDEEEDTIQAEVERACSAFILREQKQARCDTTLRQQIEATECHIAVMREGVTAAQAASAAAVASAASAIATPSPKSGSVAPASSSTASRKEDTDWAKRFHQASKVYDGWKKLGLPSLF
jgi:hypothetical protein